MVRADAPPVLHRGVVMQTAAPSAARAPHATTSRALGLSGALLFASAVAVPSAAAQRSVPPWERRTAPTFSVEASGLYGSMRGGEVDRLNDGFGFEAQGRLGVSAVSLGVGYQRSTHAIENFESLGGPTNDAVVSGVFVEPRVALELGGTNFTPYLSGRGARLSLTQSQADVDVNGTEVGGGGGLLVWLAPAARLNLSALYSAVRFDASGLSAGARATGNAVTLRAGVTLGF
jgi:hypothetical protein